MKLTLILCSVSYSSVSAIAASVGSDVYAVISCIDRRSAPRECDERCTDTRTAVSTRNTDTITSSEYRLM